LALFFLTAFDQLSPFTNAKKCVAQKS